MLFDKIKKEFDKLLKEENKKGDHAPFQYEDAGIEITVSKNGKEKIIKEQ